jgi:CBS domain containing-hemolysin-like protein
MTDYIAALLLLAVAVAGVVIRKTYYSVPANELKRQAERNEPGARELHRVVSYGSSLRVFLWLLIALPSAVGVVLLARSVPLLVSLTAVLLLLWVSYSWLPASRVTRFGRSLTLTVSPVIAWLLNYLHPVLVRGAGLAEKRYNRDAHTGLYEREDLLKLIEQQQRQKDSRVSPEELEIARRALSFGDHEVGDIMTPRAEVQILSGGATIGPILIDELHQKGTEYALVRDTDEGPFTGVLTVKYLNLKSKGHIRDITDPRVYFLHENDRLSEALHAFFSSNSPLFIVVNSFEEYVGVVTMENILKQLLGHVPGDGFDSYEEPAAVTTRHHKKHEVEKPGEGDEKVVE